MKKIYNYTLLALVSVILAGLGSCTNDYSYDYKGNGTETGPQVYFSESAQTVSLEQNQSKASVTLLRNNASEAAIVPVSLSDPSGLFKLAGNANFAEGAKEATVDLTFDFATIVADKEYKVKLSLADSTQQTMFGNASTTVTLKYAPWSAWAPFEKGSGTYTYKAYMSGVDEGLKIYYRESLVAGSTKAQFRIDKWFYGVSLYIDYDKATKLCSIAEQWTGYHSDNYDEDVMISDYNTYTKKTTNQSFYNSETGTFYLCAVYYISLGYFGMNYETFEMDGYVRKDYSFSITYAGGYINKGQSGAILNMAKGEDVALYKYAVAQGNLTEAQAAQLAEKIDAGEVESSSSVESGSKLIELAEDGDYTAVVVLYDEEGNNVGTVSQAFTYKYVGGAEETWTPAFVGTFTYTVYFGSEDEPYEDKGLTLSISDSNPNRFKISHVFYDVDFIFEMDEEGYLSYEDQYTGTPFQSYGDVYVGEMRNFFEDAESNVGYYSKNTFYFYNVYFVEAGYINYGLETFKLTGTAEAKDYVTAPQKKDFTPIAWKLNKQLKKASKSAKVMKVKSQSLSFEDMASHIQLKTLK